jgi:uncharacterized membrane protein
MMRRPRIVAALIVLVAANAAACGDGETVAGGDPAGPPAASPALAEASLQNAVYQGILDDPVPVVSESEEQTARFSGYLVWGHESRSFTECDSGREGWVINESGDELAAVYEELANAPYQPMFVEVRGEWVGAPAGGFGAGFEEALRITELLRAENEGFGCRLDLAGVQFVASGNEPFWNLQIREDGMSMRLMGSPDEIVFPAPGKQVQPTLVTYESENAQSRIQVVLERRRCLDTMSGARYAWKAQVDIDSRRLAGCAAEGI